MLSLNFIRANSELVRQGARRKGEQAPVEEILELDRQHRQLVGEEEGLRAELNSSSARVGALARVGDPAAALLRDSLGDLKARVQEVQLRRKGHEDRLQELLLLVPNVPHESVPDGTGDDDNITGAPGHDRGPPSGGPRPTLRSNCGGH